MTAALCILLLAANAGDQQFFERRVKPVLTKRCAGCHNEQLNNGSISILNRETLLRGGSRGPAVVPGKPEESYLLKTLTHDGDIQMPPGSKLPAREIAAIREWIRRGAAMPVAAAPTRNHFAR